MHDNRYHYGPRLQLDEARANLIRIGLIVWKKPLYQVLSLDRAKREKPAPRSSMDNALSLGEILKKARKDAS